MNPLCIESLTFHFRDESLSSGGVLVIVSRRLLLLVEISDELAS